MSTPAPVTAFALVGAGGAIGTALRYLATEAVPDGAASLGAILAINVVGSLLLGLLVGRLSRHPGPAATRGRLLLGTGALGGFTTYSTFALDVVGLAREGTGSLAWAVGYPVASVVLGVALAWVGLVLGRGGRRSRTRTTAATGDSA